MVRRPFAKVLLYLYFMKHGFRSEDLRQYDRLASRAVWARLWIEEIKRHAGATIGLEHARDAGILPGPVSAQRYHVAIRKRPEDRAICKHDFFIELASNAPVGGKIDEDWPAFALQLVDLLGREGHPSDARRPWGLPRPAKGDQHPSVAGARAQRKSPAPICRRPIGGRGAHPSARLRKPSRRRQSAPAPPMQL
jgi:hypothetical protein